MQDISVKVTRKANTYLLEIGDIATTETITVIPSLSADKLEGDCQSYSAVAGELAITLEDVSKRHFFHLFSSNGDDQVVAERWLAFDGTPNFRDYGGYHNQSGQRVKWGHFYRSGQLASLTDGDITYFDSLNIDTVFDFRRVEETERDVSLFPVNKPNVMGLPIDPGSTINFFSSLEEGKLSAGDMENFMCGINYEFAIEHAPSYKKMFDKLLGIPPKGSLVHCSAGKDRTGFAAALMLLALDVSRKVVMQDYLLTGEYFDINREIDRIAKKYHWTGSRDVITPMLAVKESYLSAAFDAIDNNFSSVNAYLEEMLGVGKKEREYLQHCYLM